MKAVAVLGLGEMGKALARSLASAEIIVRLGSRDPSRAGEVARQIQADGLGTVAAGTYAEAAADAEVVILAAGFEDLEGMVRGLGAALPGKIVVDISTPWEGPALETSALKAVRAFLPETAQLVGAWKTNFAGSLALTGPNQKTQDVFLCGDDEAAKATVAQMVTATGFRPVDCGGPDAAPMLEAMVRVMGPIYKRLGLKGGAPPAWKFLP